MLKGLPPMAPVFFIYNNYLSTCGTLVDLAASRVKLLSAIKAGLNTWDEYWELTLAKYLSGA